jgi:hypothetical protein
MVLVESVRSSSRRQSSRHIPAPVIKVFSSEKGEREKGVQAKGEKVLSLSPAPDREEEICCLRFPGQLELYRPLLLFFFLISVKEIIFFGRARIGLDKRSQCYAV